MVSSKIILTKKIRILVDESDATKRAAHYQRLHEWQDLVYKASNMAMSHQYVQEHMKDLIYLTDEAKVRLSDVRKDKNGILVTSRVNSTYQLLSRYFKGRLHSNVITNLNLSLTKAYQADRLAYWKGERSVRSYRRDMPIPFSGHLIKWLPNSTDEEWRFKLFKMPFRTYLGVDRNLKYTLINKISNGKIKIAQCAIRKEKRGFFLLLSYQEPERAAGLDERVVAEVSLSSEFALVLRIGSLDIQIGERDEFFYQRTALQAARKRVQQSIPYSADSRGKKRKADRMNQYLEKEKKYVRTRLHVYSRMLIDACIKHRAGTLLLVSQTPKALPVKDDKTVLQNWNYYGLSEKIHYKAALAGIHVIVE